MKTGPKRKLSKHMWTDALNVALTASGADYRLIPLTKGLVAIVDADLHEVLNYHDWTAMKGYAFRSGGELMHRRVAGFRGWEIGGLEVDHREMNRRDNRSESLRVADHSQNQCNQRAYATNKSGLKGVSWHPSARAWVAQIQRHGKKYHLGTHPTAEAAHRAYCAAVATRHGEFSRTA